ncbi:MAG: hypothetical protein QNK27_11010 [Desulfuromusa sp.]|nr:hypothetical protein [Desulfuromusa sp.]
MEQPASQQIEQIIGNIQELGKEILVEILHKLIEGIQILAGGGHCHIYLEDLTMGACDPTDSSAEEKKYFLYKTVRIN